MPGREWPLVGRDAELAYCASVLTGGGGLVLGGRAGVGKSRLAREVVASMRPDGGVVTAVATAAARELPYGALAHIGGGGLDAEGLASQFADDATQPLLVVDDAHLLDDRSAALLLTLRQRGVSMVLTVRSGLACPDAVQVLWKDGFVERVEVEPLSRDETARLVGAVLGGPLVPSAADRLYTATGGNPLYLTHLVTAALASGDLEERASAWRWHGRSVAGPTLRELVASEVDALESSLQHAVAVLAYAEPMEHDLLVALVGDATIRAAVDRGLVLVEASDRRALVRFVHPLVGEYVREEATPGEGRARRRELAAAASEFPGRRRSDDLRRAVWLLDSGGTDDLDLLFRAGLVARAVAETELVTRLSEAGLAAGGGFDFLLGRAFGLRFDGRPAEAAEVYLQLWDLAADDGQRTFVLNVAPMMTFFQLEEEAEAIALLEQQRRAIRQGPGLLLGGALEALFLTCSGDRGGARRAAEQVLAEPEPEDGEEPVIPGMLSGLHNDARVIAAAMSAGITASEGHHDAAIALAARADALAGSTSGPLRGFLAAWVAERCDRRWGDFHASARRARVMDELARSLPVGPATGSIAMLSAVSALGRGRPATALLAATDAADGLAAGDIANFRFQAVVVEAVAAALTGNVVRARDALARADERFRPNVAFFADDLAIARAWVWWVEGRGAEGVALLRTESARAREDGRWGDALELDHEALRLGDTSAATRVLEAAGHVDGPLAGARAHHAKALEEGDGPGLIAAAEGFETLGGGLLALDAMAHAVTVCTAQGLRARAQEAATKLRTLRDRCEGAETPAGRVAAAPPELTRREAEIARLVAEGLSNQAIADRLVLSRRTVESHLARAFTKLGVHAREDVARAMGLG